VKPHVVVVWDMDQERCIIGMWKLTNGQTDTYKKERCIVKHLTW
jgi:hypothetical protein